MRPLACKKAAERDCPSNLMNAIKLIKRLIDLKLGG